MYGMRLSGKKLVTQTCSFCEKVSHTEAMKKTKDRNIQWKKHKPEKAQSFATATSSKKDDKSHDTDHFDKNHL
jgi:hypothetical protein